MKRKAEKLQNEQLLKPKRETRRKQQKTDTEHKEIKEKMLKR